MDEGCTDLRPLKRLPKCSQDAEDEANRLKAKGIDACYICGRPLVDCDKEAEDNGFDECDWLAAK